MTRIKTRIKVQADGTLSGKAAGIPAGEHEAEILVRDGAGERKLDAKALLARVRAIQVEIARLPVLDPRSADEIIGYNEHGHFD